MPESTPLTVSQSIQDLENLSYLGGIEYACSIGQQVKSDSPNYVLAIVMKLAEQLISDDKTRMQLSSPAAIQGWIENALQTLREVNDVK